MANRAPQDEGPGANPLPPSDKARRIHETSTAAVHRWYWSLSVAPFLLAFLVPFSTLYFGKHSDPSSLRRAVTTTGWLFVAVVIAGAVGGGIRFARVRASGNRAANTWLPASMVLAVLAVPLGVASSVLTEWSLPLGPGTPWP